MEQRATGTAISTASGTTGVSTHDRRKVWILTGYTISFLTVCGVLAYYFSSYVTH